jgi:hypothetical protein
MITPTPAFGEYVQTFIQRFPHYYTQQINYPWKTKHKVLGNKPIQAHLEGKYHVATIGRWYPEYAILDIDDRPYNNLEIIKGELGLDESNSLTCSSWSKDSYHVLLRPVYNDEPLSLNTLQSIFKTYSIHAHIEIYPQKNRGIRIPFGPYQGCLDPGREHLKEWQEKLYWFLKLNEYDLADVPWHQILLPLEAPRNQGTTHLSTYREGEEYYKNGLTGPSTRTHSHFAVLYYLWRQSLPIDTAIDATWRWLQTKHNGFSKDFYKYPKRCKADIERSARSIYSHYARRWLLPDSTHNNHRGYITKPDIEQIMQVSRGNLPRMKFAYELVKYSYPRRHRDLINIHSSKLRQWAGARTATTYLNELSEKGILERGNAYLVGKFSKGIKLNWRYQDTSQAIAYEGRAVESFTEAIRTVFKQEEFGERLKSAGASRQNIYDIKKSIFDVTGPASLTPFSLIHA